MGIIDIPHRHFNYHFAKIKVNNLVYGVTKNQNIRLLLESLIFMIEIIAIKKIEL